MTNKILAVALSFLQAPNVSIVLLKSNLDSVFISLYYDKAKIIHAENSLETTFVLYATGVMLLVY